jgi:hypothetical protein
MPVLDGLKSIFDRVKVAVRDNREAFAALWTFTKEYLAPFLGGAFRVALEVVGVAIGAVVTAVGLLIKAFQTLFEWGNKVKDFLRLNCRFNYYLRALRYLFSAYCWI